MKTIRFNPHITTGTIRLFAIDFTQRDEYGREIDQHTLHTSAFTLFDAVRYGRRTADDFSENLGKPWSLSMVRETDDKKAGVYMALFNAMPDDVHADIRDYDMAMDQYGECLAEAKMSAHSAGYDGLPAADAPQRPRKPESLVLHERRKETITAHIKAMSNRIPWYAIHEDEIPF